ncbi:hypothetical protein [Dyella japonica]|uniref:hypothetical protein n=1 Tax=Dyella japonica TaxID=231455 RepID=UPI003392FDDE
MADAIRLLAIGLMQLADRDGRLEDRPRRIQHALYGYHPQVTVHDVMAWIDALEAIGFVRRYTVDGRACLLVVNFRKHQHIHAKEAASVLPPPPIDAREASIAMPRADAAPAGGDDDHAAAGEASANVACDDRDRPLRASVAAAGVPAGPAPTVVATALRIRPKGKPPPANEPSVHDVVALYNRTFPELRRCDVLTTLRVALIRQRTTDHLPTIDHWRRYFTHVRRCPFLMGKEAPGYGRSQPFRADLEWLTRPGNFAKVAEDKYGD